MMRAWMFALALAWMLPAPAAVVIDELPATGAAITLADARDPAAAWRPAGRDAAGSIRPQVHQAIWYRVRAEGPVEPGEYVFSLRAGRSFQYRLYAPPDYEPQPFFATDAPRAGEFSQRLRAVTLARAPDAGAPVYLEVPDGAGRPAQIGLSPIRDYRTTDLAYTRFIYSALAAMLVLLIVNLAIWIALRERAYLYFIGYMGGTAAYVALSSGEGYVLPVLEWFRYWSPHGAWFVAVLTAACGASFLRSFLDLDQHTPLLARVFRGYAWLMVGLSALLLWPWQTPQMWFASIANLLLALLAPLGLVAAALAWKRGSRYAWIYLLGWCPLVSFTTLRTLQLLGLAPDHPIGEYGYYASTAVAALVFTLGLAWRAVDLRAERDLAVAEAGMDPLTGVLNRRAMRARFEAAFANAVAHRRPLAVLFLDLDHFKRINDNHGHAAGDACLENLAFVAQSELRLGDILGRYGGEEFAAMLLDADAPTALRVAEAIRERLARDGAWFAGRQINYTVTIGVAVLGPHHASLDAMLAEADRLLYAGKHAGRNRVMFDDGATLAATA
jgi:diguanylate cyclase (GGDEF)-like protein